MKRRKKGIATLLLALCVTLGLLPALTPTASAATLDENSAIWSENSTITDNVRISDGVTVTADITLTIPEGKTLTVNGGINAAGKTLTVEGTGTLIVTSQSGANGDDGADGEDGSSGSSGNSGSNGDMGEYGEDGRNGGNGGAAITGNMIVNGTAVTVTGGDGGNGGNGGSSGSGGSGGDGSNSSGGSGSDGRRGGVGGWGGNGGAGVTGDIVVNRGIVNVTGGTGGNGGNGSRGGSGGSGGWGDDGGDGGNGGNGGWGNPGGDGGVGVTGNVTVNGGRVNVTGGTGGHGGQGGEGGHGGQGGRGDTGGKGGNGGDGGDGGRGGHGGAGVTGSITISGGEANVTGGSGANGGRGGRASNGGNGETGNAGNGGDGGQGGNGGNGGAGVSSNIIFSGGYITVNGGESGNGGDGDWRGYAGDDPDGMAHDGTDGNSGNNGSPSKAVAGSIGHDPGFSAQESDDNSSWSDISGSTSDRRYVKITAPQYTVTAADTTTETGKKYHNGEEFTIAVTVSGGDFEGGEFTLNYDSDTLDVKTLPTGNKFGESDQTAGSVKFELLDKTTKTDGAALATIVFTVKTKVTTETTCDFTFEDTPKICYDTQKDSVAAATVTPGSVIVEPVTYEVTLTGNDGVTFVKGSETITNDTAIEGQEFTAQMGAEFDDKNYEYSVTLTIGGAAVVTPPQVNSDGTIKIPAESVEIADTATDKTIVLTVGRTLANFTVTTTADYVTGWTLVTVAKASGRTDNPVYNYDGNAMYYVNAYGAYAYLVEGSVTKDTATEKVSLGTSEAVMIAAGYDVNNTGKVDYSDTLLTYRCYEVVQTPSEAMETYLRADVDGSKKVDTEDVSAIDANRTPETT